MKRRMAALLLGIMALLVCVGARADVFDDDGVLRIRFYAGAQEVSGAVSEMLEVDEGDEYIPLIFDVATQRLARGASTLTVPAGDWVLKKSALTGNGYSVVIGATDLTGQLQWSTGAVSLPLAP